MELRNSEAKIDELTQAYKSLAKSTIVEGTTVTKTLRPWKDLFALTGAKDEGDASMMDEESTHCGENLTAKEMLDKIRNLEEKVLGLEEVTTKFRQRMAMKDPVTNKPRYGEKTMTRVKALLRSYDTLKLALDEIHGNENERTTTSTSASSLVASLTHEVNSSEALKIAQKEEEERSAMEQKETAEKLQREEEERLKREKLQEELRLQREREELAARAEIARRQRIEAEDRAAREEYERERAYIDSVPKGGDGVRAMLERLRKGCPDKSEFDVAIDALYTLFTQIASRPEEEKFRRVRRDHPKFNQDIGRHDGGAEVLIAAGFRFAEVECVKCLFSREPDLETDMDGWTSWFDLIKETVSIIEEEMMK